MKPKKPLSRASVSRFQAVTLGKNAAIILDTEEGHLWMWRLGINTISLIYAGQVFPGKDVGEVIYETSLKTKLEAKDRQRPENGARAWWSSFNAKWV